MEFRRVLFRSTVDGVIAVVDGPAVADGLFAGDPEAVAAQRAGDDSLDHDTPLEELFEEQLACADMVVINKADLLDAARLVEVEAAVARHLRPAVKTLRSEEHTSELQSLMRTSYAAFCFKTNTVTTIYKTTKM